MEVVKALASKDVGLIVTPAKQVNRVPAYDCRMAEPRQGEGSLEGWPLPAVVGNVVADQLVTPAPGVGGEAGAEILTELKLASSLLIRAGVGWRPEAAKQEDLQYDWELKYDKSSYQVCLVSEGPDGRLVTLERRRVTTRSEFGPQP